MVFHQKLKELINESEYTPHEMLFRRMIRPQVRSSATQLYWFPWQDSDDQSNEQRQRLASGFWRSGCLSWTWDKGQVKKMILSKEQQLRTRRRSLWIGQILAAVTLKRLTIQLIAGELSYVSVRTVRCPCGSHDIYSSCSPMWVFEFEYLFFAVKHRSCRYGNMETYKKQDQSKTLFPLISPWYIHPSRTLTVHLPRLPVRHSSAVALRRIFFVRWKR